MKVYIELSNNFLYGNATPEQHKTPCFLQRGCPLLYPSSKRSYSAEKQDFDSKGPFAIYRNILCFCGQGGYQILHSLQKHTQLRSGDLSYYPLRGRLCKSFQRNKDLSDEGRSNTYDENSFSRRWVADHKRYIHRDSGASCGYLRSRAEKWKGVVVRYVWFFFMLLITRLSTESATIRQKLCDRRKSGKPAKGVQVNILVQGEAWDRLRLYRKWGHRKRISWV